MTKILLVNFGGPRALNEVAPFLETLLLDRDMIRTPFPKFIHDWFFKRVARKRTAKVCKDYEAIGGGSMIYFDTEFLALALSEKLQTTVYTFHRYLPFTHEDSLKQFESEEELKVLP